MSEVRLPVPLERRTQFPPKGFFGSSSVARWREHCSRVKLRRRHHNFAPSRGTNANLSGKTSLACPRPPRRRRRNPSSPPCELPAPKTESNSRTDTAPTAQHERASALQSALPRRPQWQLRPAGVVCRFGRRCPRSCRTREELGGGRGELVVRPPTEGTCSGVL